MIDFSLSEENRLVRQSVREFVEAEILPEHPRVGREGRGPPRGLREDGRAGLPRRADPRGVGRRRAWTTSRFAILCEELERADTAFRVVHERPRRPQLADAPPVGDRRAEAALARAPGAGQEAGDLRADRAGRGHGRRRRCSRPPGARATPTSSTAARSGSAWPTSPTTSSSSPRSTGRSGTRASPPSWSSGG